MAKARLLVALLVAAASSTAAAACGDDGASPASPLDAGAEAQPPGAPREAGADAGDDPLGGPSRLSETGLYADFAARTLAPGVVRFVPAHPLWSDGAAKERFFLLPPGAKIDTSDMDRWRFPVGTKAWKSFRVDGKLVETRMLWKVRSEGGNDDWFKVAYVWEPDGSDAVAAPLGVTSALGTTHDVPSQEDCVLCHGNVVDRIIGFSALELSDPYADGGAPDASAADAGAEVGRIFDFAAQGMFSDAPARHYVVPGDGNDRDAVAYLHGNCGFCHNGDGQLQFQSSIRLRVLTTDATLAQTGAYTTTINALMRHVMGDDIDKAVVPGQPDKSQLYGRMITTDIVRMPPKGTKVVDDVGAAAVRDWILALPP